MVALCVARMFIGFVLADMLVQKRETRLASVGNSDVGFAAPYQMAAK